MMMMKSMVGGLQPRKTEKKTEKKPKKPVPNLKFAVAFGFFSVFCGTFSVFFQSELRQEIPAIQKSCP